ncbi:MULTISPECIES: hypothetical protein [Gordonia]|uniref:hypothetical protein n=1 Tax=Gordonia TaxID=2053 RepID=UPI001331545B|nr:MULTISPECIES: hypothetical protein [Gordonia]KAF0967215.1 hypothetical protein BPODLACK_04305 [Gordonia sp. YY1]UPW14348.1 hypothetical protein M0655_01595 [Gordonia amicalis]
MFTIGVVAASLAAVAYGLSTVLRALGARNAAGTTETASVTTERGPSLRSTLDTFRDPAFLIGTLMVILGFAGGAVAARLLPLFLAQTIVAGNLIITALLGSVLLGTTLRGRDLAAMGVVVASLCMLGASASHEAATAHDMAFHWALFIVSTTVAVVGVVVVHLLGRRGAILAGALAGAMYGALAVAVRVLDGVHPFDAAALVTDPAAWTIAIAGAVAFYVQTVALQLGPVNAVTAVLVVGEVGIPSVIGVLFLGDRAVDGLGWLAYVGFAGAIAGAFVVAWLTSKPESGAAARGLTAGSPP